MKNEIIYWHGGGYPGCTWEPNMGFFDSEGVWHPVISTGSGALDTAEDVLAEFTAEDVLAEFRKECDPSIEEWEKSGIRSFSLGLKYPLAWLCDNVRIDFVVTLADALVKAGYAVEMKCTHCGEWFSSMDYTFSDISSIMYGSGFYRGDNGIGIITDELWCDECRYCGECPACREITLPLKDGAHSVDTGRLDFSGRFGYDLAGVCEYCWDLFVHRHDRRCEAYPTTRLLNGLRIADLLSALELTDVEGTKKPDPSYAAELFKYFDWKNRIEGVPADEAAEMTLRNIFRDPDSSLPRLGYPLARKLVRNLIGPVAEAYWKHDGVMDNWEPDDTRDAWDELMRLGKENQ